METLARLIGAYFRRNMKNPRPIPQGFEAAVPMLIIRDSAKALPFYKRAFGAEETMRIADADGRIVHAEMKIGKALVMIAEEDQALNQSPKLLKGTSVIIHLYVEDVDAFVSKAEACGAKVLIPVTDQFYGDRSGRLADPFGHFWIVSTRIEDVSVKEMQKRAFVN